MIKIKHLWIPVLAVLGIIAAAMATWVNRPPLGSAGGVIEIKSGVSAGAIAAQLREGGFVRSALWVKALARAQRADQKLKAGYYRIAAHQRADQILRDLVKGRGSTVKVTLPEGYALWQTAERLAEEGICAAGDFSSAATGWEGFLFPDTYYFDRGVSASTVVSALRRRFDVVWKETFEAASEAHTVFPVEGAPDPSEGNPDGVYRASDGRRWTVRQAVTLASLIERESSRGDERRRVSAVFHNRLNIGMRLECDPTVQYALGRWKQPLTKADLRVDSPFNTYRRYGLPPAPIAAPGRAALAAALAPSGESSLYFVSDAAGGHWFSSNYEDHLSAVRRFRRALRERKAKPYGDPNSSEKFN